MCEGVNYRISKSINQSVSGFFVVVVVVVVVVVLSVHSNVI